MPDPEYEEVEDLIYERTGTLSFPYPPFIVASVRATEAAGAGPGAIGAPSSGSESSAWSSLGRLVRDLRAASAGTPGVLMLASVDVAGVEPASTAKRREPSTAPPVAEAKANSRTSTSISRAVRAPRSVPQPVAAAPALVPPRWSPGVANRALGKVTQTFATPSPPTSRHVDPSRRREVRSCLPRPNATRPSQPSLPAKRRARRSYPSFGQRVLAETRRIPLAKRSAAVGVVAAVVVAGVFVASVTLARGRVPQERVASRWSVIDQRAPVPAPAQVEPGASGVVAEGNAIRDGASSTANGGEDDEMTLERPAIDARPTGDHSKRAKATARSNRRAPRQPRPHEPCDCFPGDPLCGCLD
jgi:hypothetical protein